MLVPRLIVIVDPGISVQVVPLVEVYAVYVSADRVIFSQAGTVPVGLASFCVFPFRVLRTWALIPSPGLTSRA